MDRSKALIASIALTVLVFYAAGNLNFSVKDTGNFQGNSQQESAPAGPVDSTPGEYAKTLAGNNDDPACLTAEESWDHIGETSCVEYVVVNSYKSSGGNVFLNEKQEYSEGFTATIFAASVDGFDTDPVLAYSGKTIRVEGLLRMYQGHPEIIVKDQGDIGIISGVKVNPANNVIKSDTVLASSPVNCITAEESWDRIGETLCVEYVVRNPYRSSAGNVFLNELNDYKKSFTTTIFSSDAASFGDPVSKYGNKRIRVTGPIQMYQGHPEIIARDPGQIVPVE